MEAPPRGGGRLVLVGSQGPGSLHCTVQAHVRPDNEPPWANNLLWVWNSVDPSWYPGNDVVDIVSADIYGDEGDHSAQKEAFTNLQTLTDDTRLVALGEVGNIPDVEETRAEGAQWAYWVVWNGEFIKEEAHNSMELKKKVYGSEYILTRDELEGWKA